MSIFPKCSNEDRKDYFFKPIHFPIQLVYLSLADLAGVKQATESNGHIVLNQLVEDA